MKRHGVTASFHTNEPAGTQTSSSALLKVRQLPLTNWPY